MVYGLIVGSPVTNCQTAANADVTDTLGGTIVIEESWSVGTSVGLNFGTLNVGASAGWSQTKQIQYDQHISIVIHPGQMVRRTLLA
jgi:hypothetical protein